MLITAIQCKSDIKVCKEKSENVIDKMMTGPPSVSVDTDPVNKRYKVANWSKTYYNAGVLSGIAILMPR